MSIAVLQQVYEETRRLAIGGSGLAKDDFRLKKLVEPLEQSAKKAPVFGQVAKAIEQLFAGKEKQAPSALLDLSSLVLAILYTQGKTTSEGTLAPIQTLEGSSVQNQLPSRLLKPIIEAISTNGPSRWSVVYDAHTQGQLSDLRLIPYAIDSLDDSFTNIANLMAKKVLPTYGKSLFPHVVAKTDIKGKSGDARRLKLLQALDPQAARSFVMDARENGSKAVQAAATECLGSLPEDLPVLLAQAKSKSKEVRRPAIARLGKYDDDAVVDVLVKAMKGTDFEQAVEAIRRTKNKRLIDELCSYLSELFNRLFAKSTVKEKEQQFDLICALMVALQSHHDKVVIDLLNAMYDRRQDLRKMKNSSNTLERLHLLMLESCNKGLRQRLVDDREEVPAGVFETSFAAGIYNLSSKAFYDAFAPLFVDPGTASTWGRDRRAVVEDILTGSTRRACLYYTYEPKEVVGDVAYAIANAKWDKRWLEAAIKAGSIRAAGVFGETTDTKLKKFLLSQLDDFTKKVAPSKQHLNAMLAIIDLGYPEATDLVAKHIVMCDSTDDDELIYGQIRPVARKMHKLPATSIPVVEALYPNLRIEVINEIRSCLEHIQEDDDASVDED